MEQPLFEVKNLQVIGEFVVPKALILIRIIEKKLTLCLFYASFVDLIIGFDSKLGKKSFKPSEGGKNLCQF